MALVSQDIKNLVAGISQQPQILRHSEQLETQINGMSTETGGLQKRPPTVHIANLGVDAYIGVKPLIHFIKRDESEQYIISFNGTGLQVWDRNGVAKTVNYQGAAQNYIISANPRKDVKVVTIADYTFIVNTSKTVAMNASPDPDTWATQGALVNVKSGMYGRTYSLHINGTEVASVRTPTGSKTGDTTFIDTNDIVAKLVGGSGQTLPYYYGAATDNADKGYVTKTLYNSGYTSVTTGEGWLYINAVISNIATKDGYNNQAMFGFLKSAQKFTNLPAQAPSGFTIKIEGEAGSEADDYYVKYDSTANLWKETVKPGLINAFDMSTMPHVLIRETDGTFTLKQAEWDNRKSGDDGSNPVPTFINEKINDIFFYRNRLGVLAGENVILTQSANFFNWWMDSVVEVQDTDPIDLPVSDNKVSILYHAVPFEEDLLLFSTDAQFALRATGIMTPKNAKTDLLTSLESSPVVKPKGAGRNIYFITERSQFSNVKEYFNATDNTNGKDSQDITSHVPNLVPNGVYKIVSSTAENVMLYLTTGAESRIYVYKYLFLNGTRMQSSWSYWDMQGTVVGAEFIGSEVFLVIKRGSYYYLEKMTFSYNTKDFSDEPYRLFMDRKKETDLIREEDYDSMSDTTTIDISTFYNNTQELPSGCLYGVVDTEGYLTVVPTGQTTVTLQGNLTGQKVFIGQLFEFKVIFSDIYIKDESKDGSSSTVKEGRLQVQRFSLNYENTGYFKVLVDTLDKGNVYTYEHTGNNLDSNASMDALNLRSGKFNIPIQSLNTQVALILSTSTPSPIALVGASWQGNYNARAKRL